MAWGVQLQGLCHKTQIWGWAIFHSTVARQIRGPGQTKSVCGQIGLADRRGEAQVRCRNQIHWSPGQQLVAPKTIERKLRNDADHVNFAAGEFLSDKAVACADIHDAIGPVRLKIIGGIARNEGACQGERHPIDAHELSFKAFVHGIRGDFQGLRQCARPEELHRCQIGTHFKQAIVLGDFTGDGEAVPNFWGGLPIRPVCPWIQGDAGCGILQVAHGTEVVVAGHHACHCDGLTNVVILAHVENGLLAIDLGNCKKRKTRGQVSHILKLTLCVLTSIVIELQIKRPRKSTLPLDVHTLACTRKAKSLVSH